MKNRRITIGAFLLIAVLCLGIGFAALTDNLIVNGSINYSKTYDENGNEVVDQEEKDFNEDIQFVSAFVDATSTVKLVSGVTLTVENENNGDVNDMLAIVANKDVFTAKDQKLVIHATVKNDSETNDATVAAVASTAFAGTNGLAITVESTEATIPAGGTGVVVITITVDEVPAAVASTTVKDAVDFALTLVATQGN